MFSKSDAYRIQSLKLFCTNTYFSLLFGCKLGLKGLPYFLTVSETVRVNDLCKQESIASFTGCCSAWGFSTCFSKFTAFASKIHYNTVDISATSWIKARWRHRFARLCTQLQLNNLHSFGSSFIAGAALQDNPGPHGSALPRVCTGTPELCNALLPPYAKQCFGLRSANSSILFFCMGKYETMPA